jgi:hypothetical protein
MLTENDWFSHLCDDLDVRPDAAFRMLTAYLDDSGTHAASNAVVCAGFISDAVRWKAFNREWPRALRKAHFRGIVRATELENRKGAFAGWDVERQHLFYQQICPLINHRIIVPVGNSVIRADWRAVMPEDLRRVAGDEFGWCVYETIKDAARWARKTGYKGKIAYVLEAGTPGMAQARLVIDDLIASENRDYYQIESCTTLPKGVPPLQAADLLAYEMYKQMDNQVVRQTGRRQRLPFALMLHKREVRYLKYWNRERCEGWLERSKPLLEN